MVRVRLSKSSTKSLKKGLQRLLDVMDVTTKDKELISEGLTRISKEISGVTDVAAKKQLRSEADSIVRNIINKTIQRTAKEGSKKLKEEAISAAYIKLVNSESGSVRKRMGLANDIVPDEAFTIDAILEKGMDFDGKVNVPDDIIHNRFLNMVGEEAEVYIKRRKADIRDRLKNKIGENALPKESTLDAHVAYAEWYGSAIDRFVESIPGKEFKPSKMKAGWIDTPKDTLSAVYKHLKYGSKHRMNAATDLLREAHDIIEAAPFIESVANTHEMQMTNAVKRFKKGTTGLSKDQSDILLVEYLNRAFPEGAGKGVAEGVDEQTLAKVLQDPRLKSETPVVVDKASLRELLTRFAEGSKLKNDISDAAIDGIHQTGNLTTTSLYEHGILPELVDHLEYVGNRVPAMLDDTGRSRIVADLEAKDFNSIDPREVDKWVLDNVLSLPRVNTETLIRKRVGDIIRRQHDGIGRRVKDVMAEIGPGSDSYVALTSFNHSYASAYGIGRKVGMGDNWVTDIVGKGTSGIISANLSIMLSSPLLAFTNSLQLLSTGGVNIARIIKSLWHSPIDTLGTLARASILAPLSGLKKATYNKVKAKVTVPTHHKKIGVEIVRDNIYAHSIVDEMGEEAFMKIILNGNAPGRMVNEVLQNYYNSTNPLVEIATARRHYALGFESINVPGMKALGEGSAMAKNRVGKVRRGLNRVLDGFTITADAVGGAATILYTTSDITARNMAAEVYTKNFAMSIGGSLKKMIAEAGVINRAGGTKTEVAAALAQNKINFINNVAGDLRLHKFGEIKQDLLLAYLDECVSGAGVMESKTMMRGMKAYVDASIDLNLFTYHTSNRPAMISRAKNSPVTKFAAVFKSWPLYASRTYGTALAKGWSIQKLDHFINNKKMYKESYDAVLKVMEAKGFDETASRVELIHNTNSIVDATALTKRIGGVSPRQVEQASFLAARRYYQTETLKNLAIYGGGAIVSTGLAQGASTLLGDDDDAANMLEYALRKVALINMITTVYSLSEDGVSLTSLSTRVNPLTGATYAVGKEILVEEDWSDVEIWEALKKWELETPEGKLRMKMYDDYLQKVFAD